MPTSIATLFSTLRAAGRMAFMPFVTAGDPDMAMTQELIRELAGCGVDLIEVGFPYSDPIADGPVIQASYTRALEQHAHVQDVLAGIAAVTADGGGKRKAESGEPTGGEPLAGRDAGTLSTGDSTPNSQLSTLNSPLPPLVAMVSYAIVFRHGPERFVDEAREAGFAGLIVPDLPGDEAAELFEVVRSREMDLIQLVAPTTPPERVRSILAACSGFVYCVAAAGTTGERERVASDLLDQLRRLRGETDLPLCVGFGISRPEHVEPLRGLADGVIVGSAIVRHLQELADGEVRRSEVLNRIRRLGESMTTVAHYR